MNRRAFLLGFSALVAAPVIVRAIPVYGRGPFVSTITDLDRLNTLLMEALDSIINPRIIVENVHDINQASELAAALPFGAVIRIGGAKRYDLLKVAEIRKHRAEWTARYPGAKLLP